MGQTPQLWGSEKKPVRDYPHAAPAYSGPAPSPAMPYYTPAPPPIQYPEYQHPYQPFYMRSSGVSGSQEFPKSSCVWL